MATDLHEGLADLAGRTPPASPPTDLWDRGVRRRRVVAASRVAVALVLVALVGLGGWTWNQSRPVEPANPNGSAQLPDHLYAPDPWLSSFGEPPGQLVALLPAEQKSLWHTSPGLVGVTASAGRYGFLRLPSNAVMDAERPDSPPSLSPDGRHVAFWTTGSPSGTPNTKLIGYTITGVGVYDTETGRVQEKRLQTVHGLSPELLQWTDDHTLALGLAHAKWGDENPNSCCDGHWDGLTTWDIAGTQGPVMLTNRMPMFVDANTTSGAGGVLVWSNSARRVDIIDPRPPGQDVQYRLSAGTDYAVVSPDGDQVAVVSHPNRGILLVGHLPNGTRHSVLKVRLRQVTSETGFVRGVSWTDDQHVVTRRLVEERTRATYRLESVDVTSGSSHVLVKSAASRTEQDPVGPEYASELLSAPVVKAIPPANPRNRRVLAIGVLVGVALFGLLMWRARRGRRA